MSSDYRSPAGFVPFGFARTGAGASGTIEWQVFPADPDDFAEAYHDETDVATTTRRFWVRPGYAYDFRVRVISGGVQGNWTEAQR